MFWQCRPRLNISSTNGKTIVLQKPGRHATLPEHPDQQPQLLRPSHRPRVDPRPHQTPRQRGGRHTGENNLPNGRPLSRDLSLIPCNAPDYLPRYRMARMVSPRHSRISTPPPARTPTTIKTSPASSHEYYFVCAPIKGGPPETTSEPLTPPPVTAITPLPATAST